MLQAIRDFFDTCLAGSKAARPAHTLELAAAALLVKVARRLDPRLTQVRRPRSPAFRHNGQRNRPRYGLRLCRPFNEVP